VAKIALVNPQLVSSGWQRGFSPQTMDDALPRHSLLFLSTPLKRAGHEVVLVDLRLLSGWAEYEDLLHRELADFVCITAHTAEAEVALECCRRAKRVLPGCTTVVGGIHFTMFPDLGEREGNVDHVIRGEGELTLPKLLANPTVFPRVVWGEPPDLDALPFEDRELYPDYADRLGFSIWILDLGSADADGGPDHRPGLSLAVPVLLRSGRTEPVHETVCPGDGCPRAVRSPEIGGQRHRRDGGAVRQVRVPERGLSR